MDAARLANAFDHPPEVRIPQHAGPLDLGWGGPSSAVQGVRHLRGEPPQPDPSRSLTYFHNVKSLLLPEALRRTEAHPALKSNILYQADTTYTEQISIVQYEY